MALNGCCAACQVPVKQPTAIASAKPNPVSKPTPAPVASTPLTNVKPEIQNRPVISQGGTLPNLIQSEPALNNTIAQSSPKPSQAENVTSTANVTHFKADAQSSTPLNNASTNNSTTQSASNHTAGAESALVLGDSNSAIPTETSGSTFTAANTALSANKEGATSANRAANQSTVAQSAKPDSSSAQANVGARTAESQILKTGPQLQIRLQIRVVRRLPLQLKFQPELKPMLRLHHQPWLQSQQARPM